MFTFELFSRGVIVDVMHRFTPRHQTLQMLNNHQMAT